LKMPFMRRQLQQLFLCCSPFSAIVAADSDLLANTAAVAFMQGMEGLALPHQRLSLYAMGSDALDFFSDCLGDLDAFLAANGMANGAEQQQQQCLGLPRISDALGEMAATARPGGRFGGCAM
jgi:hypothetical protein